MRGSGSGAYSTLSSGQAEGDGESLCEVQFKGQNSVKKRVMLRMGLGQDQDLYESQVQDLIQRE